MTISFNYKKVDRPPPLEPDYSPMLPVTLQYKDKSVDVLALLDSGADTLVVPKGIAEILGIDLSGQKETVIGIGKAEAIDTTIDLILQHKYNKYHIRAEAKVILTANDSFPVLLGRADFFEAFHITFKENEKKVSLKHVK